MGSSVFQSLFWGSYLGSGGCVVTSTYCLSLGDVDCDVRFNFQVDRLPRNNRRVNSINSFRNEIVGVLVLISVGGVPSSSLVWLVVLGSVGKKRVPLVIGLVGVAGFVYFEGNCEIVLMRF